MSTASSNRGLDFSYFLSMSALGFILPFLPLYLAEKGVSDQALGLIWAIGALTGILQLPVGKWSDQPGRRRPILLGSLIVVALAGLVIPYATSILILGCFVVLFSEHGIPRSLIESLSGAEVRALAKQGEEGRALSALRIYRPAGIILITVLCGWLSRKMELETLFNFVAVIQVIAIFGLLLMSKPATKKEKRQDEPSETNNIRWNNDRPLWFFIAAMILYHACNAPQGIYFSLFVVRDLNIDQSFVAFTFILDMVAWFIVVRPVGWLADRYPIRPLLFLCWLLLVAKTLIIGISNEMWTIAFAKTIDGTSNGMFSVICALWTVDQLGGRQRSGEAFAIVGTSLVIGSSLGTFLSSFFVEELGYRNLYFALGSICILGTLCLLGVPNVANSTKSNF